MHGGARACMLQHSSPHLITAIPVSARCHWLSCHLVSVMPGLEDPRSLGSGDGGGGAEEEGRGFPVCPPNGVWSEGCASLLP